MNRIQSISLIIYRHYRKWKFNRKVLKYKTKNKKEFDKKIEDAIRKNNQAVEKYLKG